MRKAKKKKKAFEWTDESTRKFLSGFKKTDEGPFRRVLAIEFTYQHVEHSSWDARTEITHYGWWRPTWWIDMPPLPTVLTITESDDVHFDLRRTRDGAELAPLGYAVMDHLLIRRPAQEDIEAAGITVCLQLDKTRYSRLMNLLDDVGRSTSPVMAVAITSDSDQKVSEFNHFPVSAYSLEKWLRWDTPT